jgi:hypothetical protein
MYMGRARMCMKNTSQRAWLKQNILKRMQSLPNYDAKKVRSCDHQIEHPQLRLPQPTSSRVTRRRPLKKERWRQHQIEGLNIHTLSLVEQAHQAHLKITRWTMLEQVRGWGINDADVRLSIFFLLSDDVFLHSFLLQLFCIFATIIQYVFYGSPPRSQVRHPARSLLMSPVRPIFCYNSATLLLRVSDEVSSEVLRRD